MQTVGEQITEARDSRGETILRQWLAEPKAGEILLAAAHGAPNAIDHLVEAARQAFQR